MERIVLSPEWDNIGGLKEDGEEEAEKDNESRIFDHYFIRQLLFVTSSS